MSKTTFDKRGMELYRNGVHIATRKPNEIVITEEGIKFEMIATKMLNSKKFNKENDLTPIGEIPPSKAPTVFGSPEEHTKMKADPIREKMQEEIDQLKEQNADLLEMNADKQEKVPAMVDPNPDLVAENEALRKQVESANNRVARVTGEEEHAFIEEREDRDNPWGVPEDMWDDNKPPCPEMDHRGTKTPEVIEWFEVNYPVFAKKRLAKFYQKKKIAKMREEKKKRDAEISRKERERYPRGSSGDV